MARRSDAAMADALQAMAQAVQNLPHADVDIESKNLDRFQSNKPPVFLGTHNPDGAQEWLMKIEKIFRLMTCSDEQKVVLATHMLEKEAEDWWNNTSQRFVEDETVVTWLVFKEAFLEKYFPEYERGKKEIEFQELKQENSSVADYASKFEELVKYCPHYNTAGSERSKCLKFVNGLRPEIKQGIGYQGIRQFSLLVNMSRIFDEDSRACSEHYKSVKEKEGKHQYRGEPYVTRGDKGKHKVEGGKRPSGGENQSSPKCFNCGEAGHRKFECKKEKAKCLKCGLEGHMTSDCRKKEVTCYKCGEIGHYSTNCPKPKPVPAGVKVFALAGYPPANAGL